MKTQNCNTVADCSTSGKPAVADQNLISPNIHAGCSTVADKNELFAQVKESSSLPEVLQRLRQSGVALEAVKGQIRYRGPLGTMTPEIVEMLRRNKSEVLSILKASETEATRKPSDPTAGKVLIRQAVYQIADLWNAIEHTGGSIAWEWILRGSLHGRLIGAAEDQVNAIGSRGDPAALAAACDAWVSAWREGIEAWKRQIPASGTGPGPKEKVRQ
jgi:hypothetical protein